MSSKKVDSLPSASARALFRTNTTRYNEEDMAALFREFLVYGKERRVLTQGPLLSDNAPFALRKVEGTFFPLDCMYMTQTHSDPSVQKKKARLTWGLSKTPWTEPVRQLMDRFAASPECAASTSVALLLIHPKDLFAQLDPITALSLQGEDASLPLFFSVDFLLGICGAYRLHIDCEHVGSTTRSDKNYLVPYICSFVESSQMKVRLKPAKKRTRLSKEQRLEKLLEQYHGGSISSSLRSHVLEKLIHAHNNEVKRKKRLEAAIKLLSPEQELVRPATPADWLRALANELELTETEGGNSNEDS